jgi:hypothetical protein
MTIIGSDIDLVGRVTAIGLPRERGMYTPTGYELFIATFEEERQRIYLPEELTDAMDNLNALPGKLVHYSRWGGENHMLEVLDQRSPAETYTAGPAYKGTFERLYSWASEKLTPKASIKIKA